MPGDWAGGVAPHWVSTRSYFIAFCMPVKWCVACVVMLCTAAQFVTIQASMLIVRHATRWSSTGALCCMRDYEQYARSAPRNAVEWPLNCVRGYERPA